jgi:nitroreductase
MDEIMEVIRRRFSCRSFRPEPVPRQQLSELIDAARWAPSAGNLQPWRFVVVEDGAARRAIAASAYGQRFIADAPAVIVVCVVAAESSRVYGDRGRHLYCLQDSAAAVENLLLAATGAGLGTCWIGAFDEAAVARALVLEAGWRPVALIPVGYPDEQPRRRSRRPPDEVTRWID